MYLRKLKVFDVDPEAIQQINYSGNLNRTKEKKKKRYSNTKKCNKSIKNVQQYNRFNNLIKQNGYSIHKFLK